MRAMLTPPAFLNGFVLMAGLIVAIGAQNALILRQGLMRRHVGPVVAFCAASDVLLVMAGVFGVGGALTQLPWLMEALRWGGALFLAWCGWQAARRAWRPAAQGLQAAARTQSLAATLGTTAALTYLNPHVYLDTLVLVGTVAAQQPAAARPLFAAGAGSASVLWFMLLGYGAAALAPWLARPATWRVVDAAVALVMFSVAASLMVAGL
ncbi:MAG: amino acid transporter [Aquincola sp.]|nr:amino acid transporter [Aquincola sp.]